MDTEFDKVKLRVKASFFRWYFSASSEYSYDDDGKIIYLGVNLGVVPLNIIQFAQERNIVINDAVLFFYNNKLKEYRDKKLEIILDSSTP